jgi:hypothetical protein
VDFAKITQNTMVSKKSVINQIRHKNFLETVPTISKLKYVRYIMHMSDSI